MPLNELNNSTSTDKARLANSSNNRRIHSQTPKPIHKSKINSTTPLKYKNVTSKINSIVVKTSPTKKAQPRRLTPILTHTKRPGTPLLGHKSFKLMNSVKKIKETDKQYDHSCNEKPVSIFHNDLKVSAKQKLMHTQNSSQFMHRNRSNVVSSKSKKMATSLPLPSQKAQNMPSYNNSLKKDMFKLQSNMSISLATLTLKKSKFKIGPSYNSNENSIKKIPKMHEKLSRGLTSQISINSNNKLNSSTNLHSSKLTDQIKGKNLMESMNLRSLVSSSKSKRYDLKKNTQTPQKLKYENAPDNTPMTESCQLSIPKLNSRVANKLMKTPLKTTKPKNIRVISAATGGYKSNIKNTVINTHIDSIFLRNARYSKATIRNFTLSWVNHYEEDLSKYEKGGYCIIESGDILNQQYHMLSKLGWGEFSVVWLAKNMKASPSSHSLVAIKITKGHPSIVKGTEYEIELLKYLSTSPCSGTITPLIDHFLHVSPHGNHLCMVMSVMGSNLLCVIDQMKIRPKNRKENEVNMIKDIVISTLYGLKALEKLNIVHTDLKPENVLVSRPDPQMVQLASNHIQGAKKDSYLNEFAAGNSKMPPTIIADFGLSCLLEPPNQNSPSTEQISKKRQLNVTTLGKLNIYDGFLIQTREYRAPEVLFGGTVTPRSDIWSLGCMVYELITGDFLLDPKKYTKDEDQMDIIHVAMFIELLGPVPIEIASPPNNSAIYLSKYFDEDGKFMHNYKLKGRSLQKELCTFLSLPEAHLASKFIMDCFSYTAEDRKGATELLDHSWLEYRFK